MTRYVVIGAGAVGALLAAQLTSSGSPAVLVARGDNRRAIRDRGLRIRRPHGNENVKLRVVGGPDELTLRYDDVLVLATKAQDAEAVLSRWAWLPVQDADGRETLLAADLPILTLQNGLATEDAALRRFREVFGVTVGISASHLVPGEVVSPSYPVIGVLWIGRHPGGSSPRLASFVHDLTAAGFHTRSTDAIGAIKARKLLGNVHNALDVVEAEAAELRLARERIDAEALAVYDAAGIEPAPAGLFGSLVIEDVPGHVGGQLSTWQSFARGTSSEVDYLTGEIVLLGRRHGVETPLHERLQRVLGAQAAAGEPPGTHRLGELLDLAAIP
jgi:2-dehydropantoate 2-reductase